MKKNKKDILLYQVHIVLHVNRSNIKNVLTYFYSLRGILWQLRKNLYFQVKSLCLGVKKYKYHSYITKPSIHMISEDGKMFSFGDGSLIQEEFKLIEKEP
ncbi:hypothetical protein ACFL7M_12935 [Thermodesulfobacteriota bacterium]